MSTVRGGPELLAAYSKTIRSVPREVRRVVSSHGTLLETRVKANASGRPGPRAQTGDYRRSIVAAISSAAAATKATVGTNKAQANRLERGFVGVDSLGRAYDQPPYEHFGPAFRTTTPQFLTDLTSLIRQYGRPKP